MNIQVQNIYRETISLAIKRNSNIYMYSCGKVYNCPLDDIIDFKDKNFEYYMNQDIVCSQAMSLEEFISTYYSKKSVILVSFQQSKISFIETYNICRHWFPECKICIYPDMEYAVLYQGLMLDETFDGKCCIEYKASYAFAEIGMGIIEVLCCDNYLKTYKEYLVNNELQCDKEVVLNEKTYMQFLLSGLIVKWLLLEDKLNAFVCLDIFYHNIDFVVEINSLVRSSTRVFVKNTTVPYIKTERLFLDDGKLYIYIDDFHYAIPVSEKLKYSPDMIDVTLDINPYNDITFTLKDPSNGKSFNINLYELSVNNNDNNDVQDFESEYLTELKACLKEDGEISSKERRLLNRLRERLGITEERAEVLEASLLEPELTEEEQEYLDEYKACIEEGELSSKEIRLLNRLRMSLGITEERAKELESIIIR